MNELTPPEKPPSEDLIQLARARTPARLFVDRSGTSYRSETQLRLRADHAAARDAVWAEVDLQREFGNEFVESFGLFEVSTLATSKEQYLLRPDLGRQFDEKACKTLLQRCPQAMDLQVVVGDGLSAAAVSAQVPRLLPLLLAQAHSIGWKTGQVFLVRHCRVGVLNHVGDLLKPLVAVLLIGERPGLATAESLSAYMAYCPRIGDTDARRNLISNIHARGVGIPEAANRILALAQQMRERKVSGVSVKEEMPQSDVPRIG